MKFRYRNEEEMKDSGVEWLGNIPDKWELLKLRNLGNITTSSVDKKIDEKEEMVKLVNYVDIYNSKTKELYNNSEYMNVSAKEKQIETCDLIKGDVLFTPSSETINDIGYSAVVMEDLKNTLYSYHIVRLRFIKNINLNFKKYIFWSNSFLNYLSSRATGTTRKTLSLNDFKSNCVVVPNINEQEKIARFLDEKTAQFDSIISKKESLIEKLEEAKKSLISEVVTGKVKVIKTSDGYELVERKKEEMKDSGVEWLGEIPEEWSVTKLKLKTIQVNRGKSPEYVEESKIKIINQACIYWDYFNLKNVKYENEVNTGERGRLYKNDILINSTGTGTLGRANIFKEEGEFIADSHVTIIRCKDSSFANYLKYLLRTELYQGLIYSTMVTGATNQIELSREGLRNMIVFDISSEELILMNTMLEDKLNRINIVIDKVKCEITKLKEARQSLISEAVTGKIEILE